MSGLSKDDYNELANILGITDEATLKRLRRHIDSADNGKTTPLNQIDIEELSPFIKATTALIHLNTRLRAGKTPAELSISQVNPNLRENVSLTLTPKGNLKRLTYFGGPTDNHEITTYLELTPVYADNEQCIVKIDLEDVLTGTKSQMGPFNPNANSGDWFASTFQRTQEAIELQSKRGKRV